MTSAQPEDLVVGEEEEGESQRAAASRIAATQRGKIARKRLREEQAAAAKLQAIQRGRVARAENKHKLRKRNAPIKSWNTTTAVDTWQGSLRTASVADDETNEVSSRILQGTQLDSTASAEEQLRQALSQNLVRVTDLFRTWDENSDGTVNKGEFRRAVQLLGLHADPSSIDSLFDSFDPDASGTIDFRELNTLLRKKAEEPEEAAKRPSLLDRSKWGATAAKVLLGKTLSIEKSKVEKLREALVTKQKAMITVFRQMDIDGDGRVTRAEFLRALPKLGLAEGTFSRDDADALFTDLDPDRSGWIEYRELDKVLRRDAHTGESAEQIRLAQKLLGRSDVIFVLGPPTRAKKAFLQRLAYTFGGTWLSARTLAERELLCSGSRLAGPLRRRQEADKPLPTSVLMTCLRTAVRGRSENGQLPALRGPFFLYDFPRSLKEMRRVEAEFGAAPLAIYFEQATFEQETNFADAELDAILEQLGARGEGSLLRVDGDDEVALVITQVVRHLRVHGTQQMLRRREQRKEAQAEHARVLGAQRGYLEALSGLMTSAMRNTSAKTSRLERERTEEQRQFYMSPRGLAERRVQHRIERLKAFEEAALLESPAPPSRPRTEGARSPTAMAATPGGGESLVSSTLWLQASSVPSAGGTGGGAGDSGHLPGRGVSPRVKPLFEPRIDLQLSPRNWREPAPRGVPVSISLPAVKHVYGTPALPPLPLTPSSPSSPPEGGSPPLRSIS